MVQEQPQVDVAGPDEVSPLLVPDLEGLETAVEHTGEAIFEQTVDEPDTNEARWFKENQLHHSHLGWRKPGVKILCFAIGLVTITESLVISPTIVMSVKKICEVSSQDGVCDMPQAQKEFSTIQSTQLLLSGIIGTLLAGKLGELSDRVGRKPILQYIGFVRMLSIASVLYTILPRTPFSRTGMVLANSVMSTSGGLLVLISTGNSYIADCTEPASRTLAISYLMSTIYGTMGTGPLIGSAVVKLSNNNNYAPFFVALAVLVGYTLFVTLGLTESRHAQALTDSQTKFRDRRRSFESILSNNSASTVNNRSRYHFVMFLDLLSPLKKLWLPPSVHGSYVARRSVLTLVAMDASFMVSTAAMVGPLVLYSSYKYNWGSVTLGYFISLVGIGRTIVLLVLSPLLLVWLKKRHTRLDNSIDSIDLISMRIAMVAVVLSIGVAAWGDQRGYSMILFAFFQDLSAIFSPTVQATVVKYCSKSSLGEVFGAIALVRSATMLIFPPIFFQIYGHTVKKQPKIFMILPFCSAIFSVALSYMLDVVTDCEILRRPSQISLRPASAGSDAVSVKPGDRRASTSQTLRVPTSRNGESAPSTRMSGSVGN
ncbi:LAME_0G04412g1_1 [Lachancea meyersii CBS 8951]|uniref:LAME_0G04412g1_1 n=1 Tax=Lachancea meyersii CBS 8951 TaxID=1266667 RepID=A0A1G4K6W1_9SACH|nr:LAME_0G04412g1_1 [Lachancea meyersii CBS 8951]